MSILKLAVNSADHHLGNVNAPIILVKYGDYQCSGCRRAHPFIKRLLEERKDGIHFVFRHFPWRKFHQHAQVSAVTAEAAGQQGKFWEMHDLIFENQDKLNKEYLLSLAKTIELDLVQFDKDSKSEEVLNKIETDFKGGVRSGVKSTPAFFLNGSMILTYDGTYESLADAIRLESEMNQH
jgi:protein-disulfide isomerase